MSLLLPPFITLYILQPHAAAQSPTPRLLSLQPTDSLHPARFWTALGAGTLTYGASMAGLYRSWYADYPATRFHTFNDAGEWNQMDKMGHWLMSYNESRWVYHGARWTGIPQRKAAWCGFAGGQLIQTSLEIFDGFSEQWGFSWGDVAFNTLGSGMFLAQELGWREQRITLKMSARPVRYSSDPIADTGGQYFTTLPQRADELYGTGPVNLFLKNYNTLAVWVSVNPRAFRKNGEGFLPPWLNIAAGMGAENLFGGFSNSWQAEKDCSGPDCIRYQLDPVAFPRTRQFFLSLDVDLSRIKVRNRFVRSVLGVVNIIKIPAPTIEWRPGGYWHFHPFYF